MAIKLNLVIIFMTIFRGLFSQTDTLVINYLDNYPFAYSVAGKPSGIEIDILREYLNWLKQTKRIDVYLKYNVFTDFGIFYNSIRDANPNVIGLAALADNAEMRKQVVFSPPYLENTALLITDGNVPTIKSKDPAEVATVFKGMKAVAVNKSNHVMYTNEIKKVYDQTQLEVPDFVITYTEKQSEVLKMINTDKKFFGYVNIITFWAYAAANPSKFLKVQKVFNEAREFLGFIMPKRNDHSQYLNEFFESGFGFTATKTYKGILEKYLGIEIAEAVEIRTY